MRFASSLAAVAVLAAAANAHFVFVYVPDGGAEVRVVFGHAAEPDPAKFPDRAEKTTLTARDAAGADVKLTVERGAGNYFRAKLTGKPVVVFGTTAAGVTQRGDNPPALSWYYPKVVVVDPFAAAVGKAVPLEIVPVKDGAKVRFKVLADGKPLADAEVTVGLSDGGDGKTVKTAKDGLTEAFTETGRYCVAARRVEEKAGEIDGKKYASVRHTATLVCDVPPPAK